MIRKIYLIISTLTLVGSFAIPIYFSGGVGFPFGIILYCLYALMSLVVSFISWQRGTTEGNPGDVIIPPFGFLTFGFKRVYYSDLGYFWIRKNDRLVHLYDQKLFAMSKIGEVYWDGNIEHLKLEIKKELEEIYKVQLSIKRKRDLDKKLWSEWDGSVDKKSERDNKLNELGV
jgi:hypothetical protein